MRGWDEKLAEYGIQTLLLEVRLKPELKAAVEASGEWKLVYQDNYVLLYTRNLPESRVAQIEIGLLLS